MQRLVLGVVLVLAPFSQASFAAELAEPAQQCLEAISRLQSYDVTYSWALVAYQSGSNGPAAQERDNGQKRLEQTKRDAFALGLGRRVEDQLGTDQHSISVIDWQTAARGQSLAHALSEMGEQYAALFNPDCWGFSLLELLQDKKSTIRPLEPSSEHPGFAGFEVVHPQMDRPVRVWADPDHGYMPAVIEKRIVGNSGEIYVLTRAKVEQFTSSGAAWAPLKGSVTRVRPPGPNGGQPMLAEVLVVDPARSSWNSIKSAEMFAAAGLPGANHVRPSGWRQRLSPDALAAAIRSEQMRKDIMAGGRAVPVGAASASETASASEAAATEPPAEMEAEFYQDFRAPAAVRPDLSLFGATMMDSARQEPQGFRFTLAADREKAAPAGFQPRFPISGDFEITVGYEILAADRPPRGMGSGIKLWGEIASPDSQTMTLCQILPPRGQQKYVAMLSHETATGQRRSDNASRNTATQKGQLRLVRVGSELRFYVAEGDSATFSQIHRARVATGDVKALRVSANTGDAPAQLSIRLLDLRVRAERLGAPPGQRVAEGQQPVNREEPRGMKAAPLVAIAAIAGALVLWWWAAAARRRRRRPPDSPANSQDAGTM